MRVVNLSYDDYSGFAYNNCLALRSVGIDCESYATKQHAFGYAEHSEIVDYDVMVAKASQAHIIQIFHSSEKILKHVRGLRKRLFCYHTGTVYRQEPDRLNAVFNPMVERTFIDSPEFFTLGGKNVTYIATAIDTAKIQPRPTRNEKPLFAHYPSRPDFKGTETIKRLMSKYECDFICDERILPHEQNLERIAKCDVYIELFSPKQSGKDYGSFGVTAFEAAAMGKCVITNSMFHQVYTNTYGQSGWLIVANTEHEFTESVRRIIVNGIDAQRPKMVRKWIEEYHSLEATGNYLKGFL